MGVYVDYSEAQGTAQKRRQKEHKDKSMRKKAVRQMLPPGHDVTPAYDLTAPMVAYGRLLRKIRPMSVPPWNGEGCTSLGSP